jgi:hypothetical protein
MTKKQIKLIENRLIKENGKGNEPDSIKTKKDLNFCLEFFESDKVDKSIVETLLAETILNKNEKELDLLVMLLEHLEITNNFDLILAELLIQPWHHLHDSIARILENDKNEKTIEHLYLGCLYSCDNLDYQSDYCEFNRKCLYALAKIGTKESINYIKDVSKNGNDIVCNYAKSILKKMCI